MLFSWRAWRSWRFVFPAAGEEAFIRLMLMGVAPDIPGETVVPSGVLACLEDPLHHFVLHEDKMFVGLCLTA
jgi:hypothetical protein